MPRGIPRAGQRAYTTPHPSLRDISGRRFGRLVALARDGKNDNRESFWLCLCDCGTQARVLHGNLTSGTSKSCGCLQADNRRARRKDFTGLRSGRLVALHLSGRQDRRGSYLWVCQCDCGVQKELAGSTLKAGLVISCGCAREKREPIRSEEIRRQKRAYQNKRRAKQMGAEGTFSEEEVRRLHQKQRGRCIYCPSLLGDNFHRDHLTPLSRGGSNYISNIQLLCCSCNAKKHNLDPLVFAAKMGLLV